MLADTPSLFSIDLEVWFSQFGLIAMIGWVILIIGPRRWPWLSAFPAYVIPALLSVGYVILIMRHFGTADGDFDSLANVATLFRSDHLLLAGWVHYYAFDLFIGAWIARQADRAAISRMVQAPVLVSTFMLGPLGLLLFIMVWKGRSAIFDIERPQQKGVV